MISQTIDSQIKKYYLFSFFSNFYFDRGNYLFFLASVGLQNTQIGLLQSCYFWVNLLMEVPTGIVADSFKRKFSVAAGQLTMTVVFLVFPHTQNFWVFALLLSAFALGIALKSGAEQALIYDTLLAGGPEWESRSPKVFARASAISTLTLGLATLAGASLMRYSWEHVYYPIAGAMFISFIISLMFYEKNKPVPAIQAEHTSTLTHFKAFASAPNNRHMFQKIVGLSLLFCVQIPFFVFSQPMLTHFGLDQSLATMALAGVMTASSFAVYALSHASFWRRREFVYCAFLTLPAILAINWLLKSYWVLIVTLFLSNVLQYLVGIYTDFDFNQRVDSQIRASFMSSKAFIFSLFSALSMPLVGYFMDKSNPIDVLLYLTPVPLMGLWLFWLSDQKVGNSPPR